MISLEMVGYSDSAPGSQSYPPYIDASRYPDRGDFVAVVGNEPSDALTQAVSEGLRQSSPALAVEQLVVPGRGDMFREVNLSDHSPFWQNGTPAVMITDTRLSDNASFWDEGYPALMLTDTAFLRNPNYHQATDTLETLDLDLIANVALGVAGFLKHYLSAGRLK